MRLIGHVPEKEGAQAFSDFLCVEGIPNQLESDHEGWAIWVHAEEDVGKAKNLFSDFRTNPAAAKYQNHANEAEQIKRRQELDEAEARNRYFDRSRLMQRTGPIGVGPITVALIVLCAAVSLYSRFGKNQTFLEPFWITNFSLDGRYIKWLPGLPEIRNGQVWRLITPIFIHMNMLHLVFNAMAMFYLGNMIEARESSVRLLLLVLVMAVISNLGQYSLGFQPFGGGSPAFGGISGVAYGLVGYIWIKGKFHPASGLYLQSQSVTIMLVFFVICFLPIIPGIAFANGAHASGLAVGVIWGFISAKWATRRR